jgi:DNA-binding response OmpR family regulator
MPTAADLGSRVSSHGTLLGVVPLGGGSRLAIIGYLLPPARHDDGMPPAGQYTDGLVVDATQHRALVNGRDAGLVFREFELLAFLTAHPGQAFTRAYLLANVWGEAYQGSSRTVDVHMHRLRCKLGPEHGQRLVTMRHLGYTYRPPATGALPADQSLTWGSQARRFY